MWLKEIFHHTFWNPTGKFIIFITGDVKEVFEILWRYFVINVDLFVVSNTTKNINIYTFYPYNNLRNCNIDLSPQYLFSCSDILQDRKNIILFPNKLPNQLNGCTIKMVVMKIPPYVLNINADRDIAKHAGFEVTLMHSVAKKLNFLETFIKHNFTIWGDRLPNGSYSGMYSLIIEKHADIMFGMTYMPDSTQELQPLHFHIDETLVWWVPTAKPDSIWKNLIVIYSPTMWISIFVIFIINTVIWWIVSTTSVVESRENFKTYSACVLFSWNAFLQGTVPHPKSVSVRVVFICWIIFTLLLYTAHQSQLISILTKPRYEHQISTFEDILNAKIKYGFFSPMSGLFSKAGR